MLWIMLYEYQVRIYWTFLCMFYSGWVLMWIAGDLGRRKKQPSLRQIQKGIKELFLPIRLIVWLVLFLSWIIRSDIVGYLVSCSDYCQCVVVIADALKGNRKGCLWVLLKSWQGQLILIFAYSLTWFLFLHWFIICFAI
jgi:hypothetical protein